MQKTEVIVALDFAEKQLALDFCKNNLAELTWVKVGMELYYSAGSEILVQLKDLGLKIFLDLKLHDIPNTVAQSMRVLAKHQVDMLNCHIAGGSKMLLEASKAYKDSCKQKSYLIGVTQLTSTDENILRQDLKIELPISEVVNAYAQLARHCELDGVVCAASDLENMHNLFDADFFAVCPGIRLAEDQKNDQVRVVDPYHAKKLGAKFLVVGRPITQSKDPQVVLKKYKSELLKI